MLDDAQVLPWFGSKGTERHLYGTSAGDASADIVGASSDIISPDDWLLHDDRPGISNASDKNRGNSFLVIVPISYAPRFTIVRIDSQASLVHPM